jgi:transcriptional regulator with XRE-family HTH domain
MKTAAEIFARNVTQLLKDRGWSDSELARRAGVSNRAVGMYRKLDAVPSIEAVERIASAFGFSAWELLNPNFEPGIMKDRRFPAFCDAFLRANDQERKLLSEQAAYILSHHPESPSPKER